jgi:CubicO group peptidase (beta-lactamase class C family)
VRRVSGRDLGTFFRDEVAGPLGLDFHLGLSEADEGRVAPTVRMDMPKGAEESWRFLQVANSDPDSIQGLTVRNTGRRTGDQDSRQAHAAVLPSQGGITNARGLAGMYAPLAQGGGGLVDAARLAAMGAVQSASPIDATLLVRARFGQGFLLSSDNRQGPPGARDSMILGRGAFGHPGAGGSLGFADPEARLAFGYTMNKQGRGVLLNERGQALVDAVYQSLGYRTNEPGFWV